MIFKSLYKIFQSGIFVVIFFSCHVYAQKDTILLNETEILSTHLSNLYPEKLKDIQIISKAEIDKAPVQSLQELLEYVMNIDVRQRGDFGIQADVSIRGGSYEQCLILLNGVKMNDPQTGHHSMNLPVEIQDIERIEILQGQQARIYGASAFTGAINIITSCKKENRLKLSSLIGENQLYATTASLSLTTDKMQHYFSVSKKGSDGYINNTDFDISNLYYKNTLQLKNTKLSLQTAYNGKKFGANSFYTAKYPNQFEQTKLFFADATCEIPRFYNLSCNIYYRRHQDRFELFRNNPPTWYTTHNYHLTETYGIDSKMNFNTCLGRSAFGAEFRSENILSNVLGEPMIDTLSVPGEPLGKFTKSHHRENIGLFAEQSYGYNKFNISGGLSANWNSDYKWRLNAGLDVSFDFSESLRCYALANQSMRMPTFTDLYYVGPTNLGNINLKPEEATTFETGIKYSTDAVNVNISVFRRDANNLIDWVKLADTMKWESRNLTNVITNGFEFSTQLNLQKMFHDNFFVKNIQLSYCYLNLEKNSNTYISYYALDYLKHKIVVGIEHRLYKKLSANWVFCYQERMGTFTDIISNKETAYPEFVTIDSRITYNGDNWNCFIEAANLFNKKYQDFGNIQMPGRWIRAGVNISLSLDKKTVKPIQDMMIEIGK